MDAADDSSTMTTAGGPAVANVLANDRIGGIAATLAHVTLTQMSSTSDGLALDPVSGAVSLAAGAALGVETLVYRICEIADPSNCDDATVTVTVLPPYVIDAVNDTGGVTFPGRTVVANVLANDTLGGTPATAARVTLSAVSSTASGLTLDAATGSVFVALGTTAGTHTLTYRICEIVDPVNCDDADVTVTVNLFVIDAVNDSGLVPKAGGTAVANVLANDRFAAAVATLAKVSLSQQASTHAGITLNVASGAVTVAAGTTVGAHALTYRICEIAMPSNCDDAIVAVTVLATPIMAGGEYARVSSKRGEHGDRERARERPAWQRAGNAGERDAFLRVAHAGEQQDPPRSHGRVCRHPRKDGIGTLLARVRDLRDCDADQLRARDGAARLDREPLDARASTKPGAVIIVAIVVALSAGVVKLYRARGTAIAIADWSWSASAAMGTRPITTTTPPRSAPTAVMSRLSRIAENLVPNDTNLFSDVFVRDREADTIERVSVGPLGVEGDGNSGMLARARQRRHQPRRALRRVRLGSLELRPGRHPRHGGRVRARPADAHDRAHQPRRRPAFRQADRRRRQSAATAGSWRSARSPIGWCPTATRTSSTMSSWSIG